MNPQEIRERLEPLVGDYPRPQVALVPLLHVLLEIEQPISNESLALVAEICEVDVRSVMEIVRNYAVFKKEQRTYTSLCLGLPCYLNGAKEVLDHLKAGQSLGDERIKDINISPCLGHCYAAPVLKLDDGSICKINLSSSVNQDARPGRVVTREIA
jgi:NADH:ubiquinone oxidoreductase subunit E